jgi:hypothetical protein
MTKFLSILLLAFALAFTASAQTPLTSTTLSGSVASYTTQFCLASATDVVTPALSSGTLGSYLLVDSEVSQVTGAGTTSTCFKVKRGIFANANQGGAVSHGSGAKVWVLGQNISTGDPSRPISTAAFFTQRQIQPFEVVSTPAYYSVAAHTSTDTNGGVFYGAIEVDTNGIFTGACLLNGSTVGTDKRIFMLWDATGALLANTAVAGTTTANASAYQCLAFTSPIALVGPAEYFIGEQANGTTDTFSTYAANSTHSTYPAGTQTGTFGGLPSVTVLTTFTANDGPFMALYQ